jgi:hypothetical protein
MLTLSSLIMLTLSSLVMLNSSPVTLNNVKGLDSSRSLH